MEDVPSGSFLDRAYQLLMTPLPMGMLPSLDIGGLMAALREHGARVGAMTDLPERLPQMPEAWKRYAQEQGLMPSDSVPAEMQRNLLINADPARQFGTSIPNVYRGELQPDFDSGNSLPEVYDRSAPVRI